ncbi:DegT/DnrJ/EryC1/StrS family aminotransferase [Salinibacterium sp.]|uniref:DegT/DnrJ/EryC1/StrS family aminotransferase n=1 Tax=Salinibacterium sp. TaxID=1915057 RepID=UPI00286B73C1|nr:DegT/DnrJ/EryC1/StrS family aminotransferase [Salinibacterium sp.]
MVDVPVAAPTRLAEEERRAVSGAISRVVMDGPWILGPSVERFEDDFAAFLDINHVVGVGNGTDALAIALSALDLPPGAGVLVAANEGGYASTALRLCGLEPVVMDVDELTMAPTAATAAAAIRADVSAIVVTHLHGEAIDIRELDAWRSKQGLRLIEDCAQAHGARLSGSHVGRSGDAATFSFYPTKNLGAIGDAGAVAFHDVQLATRARAIREYGWGERFRVDFVSGRNSRLDPIHAAVLSARLPFLDDRNTRRRRIAARYEAVLAGGPTRLHGDTMTTVSHHAVVVSSTRDALKAHLARCGISTAIHYPFLVSEMPGLRIPRGVRSPVAATLRDSILTVPSFPEMSEEEIERVTASLEEWAHA